VTCASCFVAQTRTSAALLAIAALTDESCMGDVGDDLLDVYHDVRGGLVAFDRGEVNDAAWHWSFLHRIHWGRHAVGGLFALHCMHVSKRE